MDGQNRFHTRATYRLVRSDHAAILALGLGLAALHWREIHWGHFALAFWWIDALGYWPGALWYRYRAVGPQRRLPVAFHAVYNAAHSVGVNLVVLGAWYAIAGEWEWAMLAQPIHLAIDGSVFGNFYKPVSTSFEPVLHPLFEKFDRELEAAGRW